VERFPARQVNTSAMPASGAGRPDRIMEQMEQAARINPGAARRDH
jgi:hypothetical protein